MTKPKSKMSINHDSRPDKSEFSSAGFRNNGSCLSPEDNVAQNKNFAFTISSEIVLKN